MSLLSRNLALETATQSTIPTIIPKKTLFNEEIDLRIADIDIEIKHEQQKVLSIKSIVEGKTNIAEQVLGKEFFREDAEHNPIWHNINSEEYRERFILHKFPFVSEIAKKRLEIFQMEDYISRLQLQQAQLQEDKVHNKYLPAELYRMIELSKSLLKSEIVALNQTAELSNKSIFELKALIQIQAKEVAVLKEKIASLNAKECVCESAVIKRRRKQEEGLLSFFVDFTILSSPSSTKWNPETKVLTHIATTDVNHAISHHALPNDKKSSWKVTFEVAPDWYFFGIIGSNQNIPADSSHYGTASGVSNDLSRSLITLGNPVKSLQYYYKYDTLIFTYDPIAQTLTVIITSLKSINSSGPHTISTGFLSTAYVHCCVKNSLSVRFSQD